MSVRHDLADVGHAVAGERPGGRGRSRRRSPDHRSGSMPQLASTLGWTMPAAAELQPGAVGALHVELGRRLGEREVRRAAGRIVKSSPDEGVDERLDGAGQVAEGDALVDHQALELVEHGQVGGVGGLVAEHPARHDRVDRRRLLAPSPGPAPARCGCAARTSPGSPRSTKNVSCMSRAGWCSPKLRAVKLCQSSSTSGPSATVKPRPTNTSSSSSIDLGDEVEVAGVAVGPHLGEVEPLGRQARPAGGRRELVPALGAAPTARSRCASLSARPTCLRSSSSSSPSCRLMPGTAALLAEQRRVSTARSSSRSDAVAAPRRGVLGEPGDLVDHGLRTVTDRPSCGKFIGRRRWGRRRGAA